MPFSRTKLIAAAALVAALQAPFAAQADTVLTEGTFTGASDHITTGGVSLVETDAGRNILILDADFSLDGAPDPSVGFGIDGTYVDATHLGELQSIDGLQVYIVPASIDVSGVTEVFIWCDEFSVPLGIATLN